MALGSRCLEIRPTLLVGFFACDRDSIGYFLVSLFLWQDPSTVNPTFVPDLTGRYIFELTVDDGTANTTDTVDVIVGVLARTGQTGSYDEAGVSVSDPCLRDDGFYEAGVPRDFDAFSSPIVVDQVTGLVWNRSARAAESALTAEAFCQDLVAGSATDWRLPSIEELTTMVRSAPPSGSTAFIFPFAEPVWTQTPNVSNPSFRWVVDFADGSTSVADPSGLARTFCVRSSSPASSVFARDAAAGVVTDSTTGLMWQDSFSGGGQLGRNITARFFPVGCFDAGAITGTVSWATGRPPALWATESRCGRSASIRTLVDRSNR